MASTFLETEMTTQAHFESGSTDADLALFLRDLVHELANPLNAISMNVEILRTLFRHEQESSAQEAIERLNQDHARLEHLLRGLRTYAEALRQPARETVTLRDLMERAQAMAYDEGTPVISTVVTQNEANLSIDRAACLRAIAAILRNAAEAGASQVVVTLRTNAGQTCLLFDDNGPGIDDSASARVADAFFTSQTDGAHFGLGLTIARAVARAHGGDIEVRGSPDGGARIVFGIGSSAGFKTA